MDPEGPLALVGPPAAGPSVTVDDGLGASAAVGAIFRVAVSDAGESLDFDSTSLTKAPAMTRKQRTANATTRAMFDFARKYIGAKMNNLKCM